MKLLTATHQTQGARPSDFCFCTEGELVVFPVQCEQDADSLDSDTGCGCGRGMLGILTHKVTTTVRVSEIPLTREQWVNTYLGSFQDMFPSIVRSDQTNITNSLTDNADEIIRVAGLMPVGAVLELRKQQGEQGIERVFQRRQ